MPEAMTNVQGLQFLKLGGSLITDKNQPHTHRPEVLARLAAEIAQAWQQGAAGKLVLGHGSGSFGHMPAKRFGTRAGVRTPAEWLGFVEVWTDASALNHLVVAALQKAGLPALAFPPSASVLAQDGQVAIWNLAPLQAALQAGLLPVVFGDVVFDNARGGTILSTEDLFAHLARQLQPERLLLAGREQGVWADFPSCTQLVNEITHQNWETVRAGLHGSLSPDVTGGMESKVQESLALVQAIPGLEVLIFSGEIPGQVLSALSGQAAGTRLG